METRKLYDVLTCDFFCNQNKGYREDVDYARKKTGMCLDLPMYSALQEEEIEQVCETIKNAEGVAR